MNFYKMVNHDGIYHTETAFYKTNSKESRSHFIEKLIADNEKGLEQFKRDPNSRPELYESTFKDRIKAFNNLKDEFVEKGTSVRDKETKISLHVHEQKMFDL